MRRYIFLAVFALVPLSAAALFALPAQAQYEMNRNMTADELNEIHREVEQLYGEDPGLPIDSTGDAQQERIAPAEPQPLPPAVAAALPEIKKTLQNIRRSPPRQPAVKRQIPQRQTSPDRRSPPAYQQPGGSRRIR